MKNVLFVNCCIRKESRTEKLCRRYLDLITEANIQEVRVPELDISPFDEDMLERRNMDIAEGALDGYRLARDFAAADAVVIAAPYWDASFPSKLKVYIENICVNGVTFAYSDGGIPVKLCRADSLVYITTAGGFISDSPSVKSHFEDLGALFAIEDVRFYCAQGLDVFPEKAEQILEQTFEKMLADKD